MRGEGEGEGEGEGWDLPEPVPLPPRGRVAPREGGTRATEERGRGSAARRGAVRRGAPPLCAG